MRARTLIMLPETGDHAHFKAAVLDMFPALREGDRWRVFFETGGGSRDIRLVSVGESSLQYLFEYEDGTNDPDPVIAPIDGLRGLMLKGTAVLIL